MGTRVIRLGCKGPSPPESSHWPTVFKFSVDQPLGVVWKGYGPADVALWFVLFCCFCLFGPLAVLEEAVSAPAPRSWQTVLSWVGEGPTAVL